MSPNELFEEYFTESVYEQILEETNRYAHEVKNKLNCNVNKYEIKTLIGFLILSGYYILGTERDYWAEKNVKVNQPPAISSYTSFIGVVDLHDYVLEENSLAIRGNKWYFCLVTRLIDMALVNSYVFYKKIYGSKLMAIKDFRRYLAVTY